MRLVNRNNCVASKQASKQARKKAIKQASKQESKKESNKYFIYVNTCFEISGIEMMIHVNWNLINLEEN